jgi:cytochrome b
VRRNSRFGRARVWDLPTRLFHWSIVLLIAFSWWSSEEAFDPWHFWSGYTILFLLLFRILWGFFGSSTARFASFVRGPVAVLGYLRAGRWPLAGHTPLGALSVLAMLASLAVQVATGLIQIDTKDFVEGPLSGLVSFETAEAAHDIHEINFNILLGLIVLHVAAILFYRFARGRRLVGPMITGRADLDDGVAPMTPAPAWRALTCAAVAAAAAGWIVSGAPPLG